LEGEGVVYVDLLESRFLVLAVGGAAALAAVAAPILTTRPALWAAELLSRLGPFQLAGAALGAILGLTIGLLLVQPLPRPEAGLGAWLPFFVTAGCGLAGALAFAGRPALLRRLLVRQVSAARPATSPRVALLPEVTPHPNGHAPAELEAPTRERAP
jgi:MFS family permease